jgi:sugar O-acyltransferase (sialic acid O-acetyltransferase NeuD family)
MSRGVVVIGAGGHAKVVLATLEAAGMGAAAVLDDNEELWGSELLGVEIQGPVSRAAELGSRGILAIGANRSRERLADELDLEWVSAVHPAATVHSSVEIGAGTVVFAAATIQPDTVIGEHVIVNTGATIDHDCRVGAFSHIAPGVNLAGGVRVGVGTLIGIGSNALPGVRLGDWVVVGAGSAVIESVEAEATVLGIPARPRSQSREP